MRKARLFAGTFIRYVKSSKYWCRESGILLLSMLISLVNIPRIEPPRFANQERSFFKVGSLGALNSRDAFITSSEINSPTPIVHSPTITEISSDPHDGSKSFLIMWFGGSREGSADVNIFQTTMRMSKAGETDWSDPTAILTRRYIEQTYKQRNLKLGNPVLTKLEGESVILHFVTTSYGGWSCSHINWMESPNGGRTWSSPKRLITSPFLDFSFLVRNPGILMEDGSLGLPIYHEFINKHGEWIRVSRAGRILEKTRIETPEPALQPAVATLSPTQAVCLLRDAGKNDKKIQWAETKNGGVSWEYRPPRNISNPDSAASLLKLEDQSLLMASNPIQQGRHRLALLQSVDAGESWREIKVIEESPNPEDEFSYPTLLQDHEGLIHLVYSYKRRLIKHLAFSPSWLNAP